MASRSELLRATSFLGGVCLFLSTIEYLFPRPVPFMRLGLANLPMLLCLDVLPLPYLLLLSLLKVLGQGLLNGTLASYVFFFSFAGTFASTLVMYLVHRLLGRHMSLIGISILGAFASNIVQVILSIFFIFGENALLIIPYFLTLGFGGGVAMGVFAQHFRDRSLWFKGFVEKIHADRGEAHAAP